MKYNHSRVTASLVFSIVALVTACSAPTDNSTDEITWAEKLGFEAEKKVLILHADDAGLCEEANAATRDYLLSSAIQSAAAMPPAPGFEAFIQWAKKHPELDIGLHLTLTSEWKRFRWPSVLKPETVPGLIDDEGMLWHKVRQVVANASAKSVEQEIRAQIEKSLSLGYQPSHLDTHMGTLFANTRYTKAFLQVAQEYGIPANVLHLNTEEKIKKFRNLGFPIDSEMLQILEEYKMPKLDDFATVPKGSSYEEVRTQFFSLVKSLKPGLTEIIFHPTYDSERIKSGAIMKSWKQRKWEAELFTDPDVIEFFKEEGIVFTNWKEIMQRFKTTSYQ